MEVINRSFGDLLRCLVKDNAQSWDLILPTAKFAYNNSVNRITGHSPFEIVTGLKPRQPVDLVHLPVETRTSLEAEEFATHIHHLHEKVRKKIITNNQQYKFNADVHKRNVEFQKGDQVMIRLRPERFPKGGYQKLHSRTVEPYKVLKSLGNCLLVGAAKRVEHQSYI